MVKNSSLDAQEIGERLELLRSTWEELATEAVKRNARLEESLSAQQFYADAAEAEAWMGEQELHMMSEEKAKVCCFNPHTVHRFSKKVKILKPFFIMIG